MSCDKPYNPCTLHVTCLHVTCPPPALPPAPALLSSQNNLTEMWALFNFTAPDVLGEARDFK